MSESLIRRDVAALQNNEVEPEPTHEINNNIVAGIESKLLKIPDLIEQGRLPEARMAIGDISRGLELAASYDLGVELNDGVIERLDRLIMERLPKALEALVKSGRIAVKYDFLGNIPLLEVI